MSYWTYHARLASRKAWPRKVRRGRHDRLRLGADHRSRGMADLCSVVSASSAASRKDIAYGGEAGPQLRINGTPMFGVEAKKSP